MVRLFSSRYRSVVAVSLAVAMLTAGCGGGSDDSGDQSELKLTLAIPGASTAAGALIYAQEAGLYKKHGLSVEIVDRGAQAASEAAAGKVDLAMYGAPGVFPFADAGRKVPVVYGLIGNLARGVFVADDSEYKQLGSTKETLMQLSGKRIVVQGRGSIYGNAKSIADFIVKNGGKAPTLVDSADYAGMSAQIISGQSDAAVNLTGAFLAAIKEKKVRQLVAPEDPELSDITGGEISAVAVVGSDAVLKKKAKAVTAFVGALQDAYSKMENDSNEQVAEVLHNSKLLNTIATETLVGQLEGDRQYWRPGNGRVSEKDWDLARNAFKGWGLTQDVTDSKFDYKNMVDMSYYDNAS